MKEYNVAIVGATGAVGSVLLSIMEERNLPIKNLFPLASMRSAGKKIKFKDEEIEIKELKKGSFKDIDIALFSAGASRSIEFASHAVDSGAIVIDNSSAFRMNKEVPLIVPEVNPEDVRTHKGIIANPNCSTIIMVVALKPLYDLSRINRVVVSTYQSVSGAGTKGILELEAQLENIINKKENNIICDIFPQRIAYNVIPHIDIFLDNDYTREEMKMTDETRKILNDPEMQISATAVRVPVLTSHSEAINIETEKKLSITECKEAFKKAKGIVLKDDPSKNIYPTVLDASGKDDIFVGRLREDISSTKGICFWVVGDQLRKGAALNAIQIFELLQSYKII